MGFWDRKKSGKILKMAVFSLFLLFFCTRICVYAAENQEFSREEEALGELDLKEVEMAVDQLLEEKQSMRGMIRDILKSGQAFSAEQWKVPGPEETEGLPHRHDDGLGSAARGKVSLSSG